MFKLESEMKAPVRRWLSRHGMHVAEEFPTGWGVCDLVGCSFDPERIACRTEHRQRQPLGSPEAVFIYGQLPDAEKTRQGVKLDALVERLAPYVSEERIRHALDRLATTNHVRVTRTGTFQKVNGWAPMFSRLVAVELKLNRLGEVLDQAKANRAVAPESIVALPADVARRAMESAFAEELAAGGIGLLAVWKRGCRLLLEADQLTTSLDAPLALWAAEYFWRIHRGKH